MLLVAFHGCKKHVFWHTSSLKPTLTGDLWITHFKYCPWNCRNNGKCYSNMLDYNLTKQLSQRLHSKGHVLYTIACLQTIRRQWWDKKIWPIDEMDYVKKIQKLSQR